MTAPDPRQDLGTNAVIAGDPASWPVQINFNGVGVDLTAIGTTWTADLRQSVSATPEIAFTVDATNAATGKLVLNLSGATTATMCPGGGPTHWYFDLQVSGGTVTPQTSFRGGLIVYKGLI